MAKNNFLLSDDWQELFDALPDEKAGQLIKAAFAFHTGQEVVIEDPVLKAVFVMIKTKIEERDAAYEQTCEDNRKHARERWQKAADRKNTASMPSDATAYDRMQNDADRDRDKDRDKEKDKDREVGKDRDKDKGLGEEKGETLPADPPADHSDLALVLEDGSEWTPDDEYLADLKKAYGCLNVEEELRRMRLATRGDPKKRRSAAGIKTFVQRWLRNAEKGQTDQPKETRPPNSKARKGFGDFEQRQYDDDFFAALERQAALGGRA